HFDDRELLGRAGTQCRGAAGAVLRAVEGQWAWRARQSVDWTCALWVLAWGGGPDRHLVDDECGLSGPGLDVALTWRQGLASDAGGVPHCSPPCRSWCWQAQPR